MKKKLFVFLFCLASFISNAQEISCNDLIDFIKSKGSKQTELHSYNLDSSWLHNVKLYKYDNKYYVITEIKESEYNIYNTKSYIFCNIHYSNWNSFHSNIANFYSNSTYGERFHKYIKDYLCNCY